MNNTNKNEIELEDQIYFGEEKNKAIAHKDLSLKRLDESFNKHIELSEYKKSNILAYWVADFANYHDQERTFNPSTLKVFKRGDIVKVNLGFNIGNEMGGLHYCVVINKSDNKSSGTLNVIPLSSSKENKIYNKKTCVNLEDELYNLLFNKFNTQYEEINNYLKDSDFIKDVRMLEHITRKIKYFVKIQDEICRMKHGSIACVNQITTISKQRIFKTPILSGIRLSNRSMDFIDEKIKHLYTK